MVRSAQSRFPRHRSTTPPAASTPALTAAPSTAPPRAAGMIARSALMLAGPVTPPRRARRDLVLKEIPLLIRSGRPLFCAQFTFSIVSLVPPSREAWYFPSPTWATVFDTPLSDTQSLSWKRSTMRPLSCDHFPSHCRTPDSPLFMRVVLAVFHVLPYFHTCDPGGGSPTSTVTTSPNSITGHRLDHKARHNFQAVWIRPLIINYGIRARKPDP